MAIVSEMFLDELIKGGYIKDEAIFGVSKEGGAKWQQLRAQLKHRFTSEDLKYAPVTKLVKRDCPQLRYVLAEDRISSVADYLYPGGIQNWERVSGEMLLADGIHPGRIRTVMDNLRDWQQFPRGRDLFVPGAGNFDIMAAIKYWDKEYGRWQLLPNPYDLISYGYFPGYRYWTLKAIRPYIKKAFKSGSDIFNLIMRDKTLIARLDELKSWQVLNPGIPFPNNIVDRLNEINTRGLVLTSADRNQFEYKDINQSRVNAFVDAGYEFPTNGIDLKRQAQRFKNCAGNYVGRIHQQECVIMYRRDAMVELGWNLRTIKQAFGPLNTELPLEVQTELIGLVNK